MENDRIVPKGLVLVLGVFLVVLVGLYAVDKGITLAERAGDKNPPKNTMSMSAEGKVTAVPDLATLNIAVTSQGASAAGLQDENSKKINAIIDLVKNQGVDKKDITTSGPNINPRYDYMKGNGAIIGYDIYQTVTIKIRGIDKSTEKVSALIDQVTDKGVNQLSGVSYSFDDADNLRQQAREQAIAKAKDKAQSLASSAGLKLGKVVSVSESGGNYPSPIPMYGAAENKAVMSDRAQSSIAPTLEPGTQEITATMTVVFEVK